MSLLTSDYDYDLPESLIARWPLPHREDSRMMVLHRDEHRIEHLQFSAFPSFLRDGDMVVLNDTRVFPARVFSDDGKIELLFLEELSQAPARGTGVIWKCLVKPGRRMKPGRTVVVGGITGIVTEVLPEGERIIVFDAPVDLDAVGRLPLPPYMERQAEAGDTERYQTVFARESGSVAAPTAGLHFSPGILEKIPHTFITLHVGVGTFKPVQVEHLADHRMHPEKFVISEPAAQAINAAKRVLAVGTTSVRVLESVRQREERISAQQNATDIFIHPPFEFKAVGAMLTNFHLPKSTLLMLVSAFAGRDFVKRAYEEAVAQKYRFYSYGDCMLVV